ncbi:MAG: acyl-CoA dehydrogenase family protein [Alphaproteobacteria bacterium]|nr:acyl-CoA dehydrogenase family protein [Alphaproteobacteria bacterium]MCB9931052.1 acyl-CoA dehydrogenase family protein [Alphaproteobacteria bacterium]
MNQAAALDRTALADPDPVARARALGPALEAASDTIETTQRWPQDLLEQLHAAKLMRLFLPASCGGEQCDPCTYFHAVQEVARHEGSVGWNMFVANSAALLMAWLPLESARTIYADDPNALIAWGAVNGQGARAVEGGYVVNGRWDFASGSRQATWMGAHGPVTEPDGSLRLNERGSPQILSWLFPVAEANRLDNWNPVGLRGTASESYTVDEVFVPEAFTSTREYPEKRREPGPLYAFTQHGLYAVGVAGVASGIARAMLAAFAALARQKAPRGRPRMADDPLVQADYAKAEAKLGAGEAYLLAVLAEIYGRADEWAPIDVDDRARVRLACTNAIQSAIEVGNWVHHAAGVSAIFPGAPFERRFRDLHTVSQQIQSRSAHWAAVGEVMLGNPPPVFY